MNKIPLLVVGGPTASGKTKLAADLAVLLGGEIICADSMQIYREMSIGTAAPTTEEQKGIPHHLFGIADPDESFSVARYLELARGSVADVAGRGRLPILCGGTGLYISSLIDNICFDGAIPENPERRLRFRALAREKGPVCLWDMLNQCDPALAAKLHPGNLGRIIRALEVYEASGVPLSEWQRRSREKESPYDICLLALYYHDRELLYKRIDARVELMLENGLLEEARTLFEGGYFGTAMQAIGYKELWGYLSGEQTLEEAKELLKRRTRRYAKRQLTWLRRDGRVKWLAADLFENYGALLEQAAALVTESGITR